MSPEAAIGIGRGEEGEDAMADVLFLVVTFVMFAALVAFVYGLDKL